MIVVRVELHSAITGRVTEIASGMIHNVGGTRTKGDYECMAFRKTDASTAIRDRRVIRTGEVKGHPRLAEPVWSLVHKALTSMGYGKE